MAGDQGQTLKYTVPEAAADSGEYHRRRVVVWWFVLALLVKRLNYWGNRLINGHSL